MPTFIPIDNSFEGVSSDTQNTLLPTAEQRQNELISKVASSGTISQFKKTTVTSNGSNDVITTVNNVVSQSTTANLGVPFSTSDGGEGDTPFTTADLIVTITSTVNTDDTVSFNVSPTITETRHANYTGSDILHHPGSFQVYRSSGARTWSILAMMISRTAEEAQTNLDMINIIRSWVMPYYGAGTEQDEKANAAGSRFGAPPDVLTLKAYGSTMVGPVPTVCTSYNWTWPNEVTYIKATNGNPFPVILNVTIDLIESYSPREYSNFTLSSYKEGDLDGAFPITSKVAGR